MPSILSVEPLGEKRALALLSRNHLGRLAFSFRDDVDLRPIFYVAEAGWIFGRTAPGAKLETILHNRWVAFQVDEIQDLWSWESVVVRGAFHLLDGEGGPEQAVLRERAQERLRAAMPEAFGDDDPAPHRDLIFGIATQEVAGVKAQLVERGA